MTDTTDDREDVSPGAGDSRFSAPDPDYDYESAAEDWDGTPVEGEATLERIHDEAVATTDEDEGVTLAGQVTTPTDAKQVREFLLREPDTKAEVDAVLAGLLEGNRYQVVETIVHKPKMYRQRWKDDLTGRERGVLFDLCCAFVRADELVSPELMAMANQQRQQQQR